MADLHLRKARAEDALFIKQLIQQVGINPMGLHWQRFVIAVDAQDRPLGCAQLKPHRPEVVELASLAVLPENQNRGVGTALVEHLLREAPRPLYLMCRSALGGYYEKFGFRALQQEEMPAYFRRIKKALALYERFSSSRDRVLIMKLQ